MACCSRLLIQGQGATPNIPPKRNRRQKPCFSKRLYRERNLIERFFSKLKHYRRVATRYDKLAANFLAMVQLASMRVRLRAHESTA
jgi:transposase